MPHSDVWILELRPAGPAVPVCTRINALLAEAVERGLEIVKLHAPTVRSLQQQIVIKEQELIALKVRLEAEEERAALARGA